MLDQATNGTLWMRAAACDTIVIAAYAAFQPATGLDSAVDREQQD